MEKFRVRFFTIAITIIILTILIMQAIPVVTLNYGDTTITELLIYIFIVITISGLLSLFFMSDSDFEDKEKEVKVNEVSK